MAKQYDVSEKIMAQFEDVAKSVESGDFVNAIAPAMLQHGTPFFNWAWRNQIITIFQMQMLEYTSNDCRTSKAWKALGRTVLNYEEKIWILRPLKRSFMVEETNPTTGQKEERRVTYIYGFAETPRYALENTEGKALPEEEAVQPPTLLPVAESWGITVGFNGTHPGAYASYSPLTDSIAMGTDDECTFAHELAHAAHKRVLEERGQKIKPGQHWKQEVVAEMSAVILMRMYGLEDKNREAWSFRYIKRYADEAQEDLYRALFSVMSDARTVIFKIMEEAGAKVPDYTYKPKPKK